MMRLLLVTLSAVLVPVSLFADYRAFETLPVDHALESALARVAVAASQEFPKLAPDNLALSVIDVTRADAPVRADYHGTAAFYPASVMKLFVMAKIFQDGRHAPEVEHALREMIQVSDNDATAYLMDVLSETTGGPELEGKALDEFIDRRRAINRYFGSFGYDVSLMMKPWSFGPYGREAQLLGANRENRNRLTANSIAALWHAIVQRRAVSLAASGAMLALLERPLDPPRPNENQIKEFFGESLPAGTKLWSKAGDTSEVRHDSAYVELPDGRKLIVVILTRAGDEKTLLPAIGRHLLEMLPVGAPGVSSPPL